LVKTGTINPIIIAKNEIRKVIEITDEKVLLSLSFLKNSLFKGLTIKVKIKAINTYNKPNFNLNRTNIKSAINDNLITDLTRSPEFIFLFIN
jgi:hypothetical protein|tara:strand:+ start:786 stop:1061 length:276 start_codon:yes stop_codon:yes gene_type:complete